jgi:hypothetical protein
MLDPERTVRCRDCFTLYGSRIIGGFSLPGHEHDIPKGKRRHPPKEGLEFNYSAVKAQSHRMCAIVRAQFAEDALDVSLDGFLGDEE